MSGLTMIDTSGDPLLRLAAALATADVIEGGLRFYWSGVRMDVPLSDVGWAAYFSSVRIARIQEEAMANQQQPQPQQPSQPVVTTPPMNPNAPATSQPQTTQQPDQSKPK